SDHDDPVAVAPLLDPPADRLLAGALGVDARGVDRVAAGRHEAVEDRAGVFELLRLGAEDHAAHHQPRDLLVDAGDCAVLHPVGPPARILSGRALLASQRSTRHCILCIMQPPRWEEGVPVADGPVAELARLAPIDGRESLADQVYGRLREAITSGALAPGLRLREVPLSQQFGVSTTPVREALRRLENDGLVETNPHRGALVAGFSLRVVGELFEVREVLERRGARLAAAAPVR